MALKFADAALKEFDVALDDVLANIKFVSSSTHLRPRLNGVVGWDMLNPEAKAMVQGFIRQKEVDVNLIYRGFVTILAGAFEHLVRRLIQDAVTALNQAIPKYEALHDSIQLQNTYRTGQALATIAEPIDHHTIDYSMLGANLATCFPGAASYVLNADAFAIYVSNMTPRNIIEAFKRLGILINWDDFGKISLMRDTLETKDTRETARSTEEFLREFIRKRNKIAHTSSGGIAVTETDIIQMVKFLRTFGGSLALVVTEKLSKNISKSQS
jgi:hypothetical protein